MRSRFYLVPVLALLLVFSGAIVSSGRLHYIMSRTFVIRYVIDPKQVDHIVKLFKNRLLLKDPHARIIGCKDVTRVALEGAKDFGVGAVCAVRSGNNSFLALMCENSRLGGLACAASKSPVRDDVIRFIENDCLPAAARSRP